MLSRCCHGPARKPLQRRSRARIPCHPVENVDADLSHHIATRRQSFALRSIASYTACHVHNGKSANLDTVSTQAMPCCSQSSRPFRALAPIFQPRPGRRAVPAAIQKPEQCLQMDKSFSGLCCLNSGSTNSFFALMYLHMSHSFQRQGLANFSQCFQLGSIKTSRREMMHAGISYKAPMAVKFHTAECHICSCRHVGDIEPHCDMW